MRWTCSLLVLLACSIQQPVIAQPDVSAPIATPPPVSPPKILRARRILITGDSEACAVGWVVKDTVKKIVAEAQQPSDSVEVDCKGGTVIQYWGQQGHFHEALGRHLRPDAVLVFLGTNHYWQGVTVPPVEKVLDVVKEQGFDCTWVGNTLVKGKHWPVNNALKVAGIPLPDGVHPNGAGAVKWLRTI